MSERLPKKLLYAPRLFTAWTSGTAASPLGTSLRLAAEEREFETDACVVPWARTMTILMVTLALLLVLALLMAGAASFAYAGWLGLRKLGTIESRPPRKLKWTALGAIGASVICIATFGITAPTKPALRDASAEPSIPMPPQPPASVPSVVAAAPKPATPDYCSTKAAARLLECGWTEEKQRKLDAEAERKTRADHLCEEPPKSEIGFLLCQKVK